MKMANAILLMVSTLFVLSLLDSARAKGVFHIEGRVYCDTCRVKFETKISEGIEGAEVVITCRNTDTKAETFSADGKTGKNGWYKLPVEGDHENDICEVSTKSSPRADCKEPLDIKARIVCSDNTGMHTDSRFANSIGFLIDKPLEKCKEVLKDVEFTLDDYLSGVAP